jgi:large conductance mechanosensitive channel
MLKEFRDFISRGNVIDLAVAVMMGAAFTGIVTALVNDILMPLIGIIMGGVDFTALTITVGTASIAYGKFIQAVINFLIIAIVMFLAVRALNKIRQQFEKPQDEAPPPPSAEETLLTEIRDLLKTRQ